MRAVRAVLSILFVLLSSVAVARADTGLDHVKVDLLADTTAVQPGKPFTVGVRFKIDPGWHIYWTNPGDSGLPTKVKLDLPAGFKAGDVQYPIPSVLKLPGDIINYAYEREVMLLATVTPPAYLGSASIAIGTKINYLVCDEKCLPGGVSLSISLPASNGSPANAGLFDKWRSRLPLSGAEKGVSNRFSFAIENKSADGKDWDETVSVIWATGFRTGIKDVQLLPPAISGFDFSNMQATTDKDGATTVVRFKVISEGTDQVPSTPPIGLLTFARPDGSRAGILVPVPIGTLHGMLGPIPIPVN